MPNNSSIASVEFCAVAIGRNEGVRLVRCIKSLSTARIVVYVDSGSIDGSVHQAKCLGADVVSLDSSRPFSAARARNTGFRRVQQLAPQVRYVQFIDGDCELDPSWGASAVAFLEAHPDVASVCGVLREQEPEKSIYNWLCEQEWSGPTGEIKACAGNVMHRVSALSTIGGYREDVIAAEEDELCFRLRAAGWRIWRLCNNMAKHDAAMTHFSQWWQRSVRAGYAFAQGAALHGASPERHFVREARRALVWGVLIPLGCFAAAVEISPLMLTVLLVYPVQILRLTFRGNGQIRDRIPVAFFTTLARLPEGIGLLRFLRDRLFRIEPTIIEHKRT